MSILDNGPHEVEVLAMGKVRTKYGTWQMVRPIAGVIVKGVTFQPTGGNSMTAFEGKDSTTFDDQFMVRGRGIWPGNTHSIIVFEGNEYDQVGLAKQYSVGHLTKHFTVQVRRRSAPVG